MRPRHWEDGKGQEKEDNSGGVAASNVPAKNTGEDRGKEKETEKNEEKAEKPESPGAPNGKMEDESGKVLSRQGAEGGNERKEDYKRRRKRGRTQENTGPNSTKNRWEKDHNKKGGRLVFQFVEVVRGKPVPPEKEGLVHMAGLIAFMILMVVVMYNDIMRILK